MTTEIPGRRYRSQSVQERRDERRSRLIEAGIQAFGTAGYRATTIEELCSAAGVSTRNFYEEFATREALLIWLHDDLNERAHRAVLEALVDVDPDDLPARADAAMAAYLGVMTTDRRWTRIALVESVGVSREAEAHRRAAIDRFVTLLKAEAHRLAAAGLIGERDYELRAVGVAGAINSLVMTLADDDSPKQLAAVAEEAAGVIVRAISLPSGACRGRFTCFWSPSPSPLSRPPAHPPRRCATSSRSATTGTARPTSSMRTATAS